VFKSDCGACVQRASAGFEAKYCAVFHKDLILSFTRTVTEAKPPVVGYILRLLWRHEVLELVFSDPTWTLRPVISMDFRNLLLYSFCLSRLFKRNLGLGIDKGRFGDCD